MNQDDLDTLIGQFSGYAAGELDRSVWQELTAEFGVHELASDTRRFFKSYDFDDGDRVRRTRTFLQKVRDRDERLVIELVQRAYARTGGADESQLNQYPALRRLDGDKSPQQGDEVTAVLLPTDDRFLQLDNAPDDFYESLIRDINRAHEVGVYGGVAVLCRKLLENLLVDVLRGRFGGEGIHTYYNPDEHKFLSFSTLIENTRERMDELRHLSHDFGPDLLDDIDDLRESANSDAHSIEVNRTREEIETEFGNVEHITRVLFRARESAGGGSK